MGTAHDFDMDDRGDCHVCGEGPADPRHGIVAVSAPAPAPSELLPCPFCGGAARIYYTMSDWCYVGCGVKNCCGEGGDCGAGCYASEAEAVAAWNRRAAPSVSDAEVARELDNDTTTMFLRKKGDRAADYSRSIVRAVRAARERCEARAREGRKT